MRKTTLVNGALLFALGLVMAGGTIPPWALHSGAASADGYVLYWVTGDWWIVGYSAEGTPLPSRGSAHVDIDSPTAFYRYRVLAETAVDSSLCYVLEVAHLRERGRVQPAETLYFEKHTLRLVWPEVESTKRYGPAPFVYNRACWPSRPGRPAFPLRETVDQGLTPQSEASDSAGIVDHGYWSFFGVRRGADTGYGSGGAQVVRITSALDTIAVLDRDVQRIRPPTPPYYEVLIAHGVIGEQLVRQLWHRDLPWFLFCEDSRFPIIAGEDTTAMRLGVPHTPRHTDVNREDLSAAVPHLRAWLIDFGRGPR